MYKTILVPIDGSKRAERILPHVENLAQSYGAKVILLRIVELGTNAGMEIRNAPEDAKNIIEDRVAKAESYLKGIQGVFREKGIESRARIVHGPVVEAILNSAERENADLIAMTSHGRGGVFRVFYGSVAAGILQRVDRPLFLIRSRAES
jgi:nucleotide-binding universal stress UspA family protein